MARILHSLPKGERIGLAFSGGLDTSVAVAWIREHGGIPCAYTADLGQYDEPNLADVPDRATEYGAELARLVDCRELLVHEGLVALQCGAFHISTAGRTYFNTTPLGRAVTGTLLVHAMAADDVNIWGDGSTYKGNDIERFYRYGLLANKDLRIYKPWLDADFVNAARRALRDERVAQGAQPPVPRLDREGVLAPTPTSGARRTRRSCSSRWTRAMDIVEPIMGVAHYKRGVEIPEEEISIRFKDGWPEAINDETFDSQVDLVMKANEIGGRHGLGMSDQIENRIIEAKSRGIYESPGIALLHIAYERLISAIHNEATIDNYRTMGRKPRPAALRGPLVRPAVAHAARPAAALRGERRHRRGRRAAAPR